MAEPHEKGQKARVGGLASGIPARGYKWEPFQPGHMLRLSHGSYASPSSLAIAPRAEQLCAEIREVLPVASPADEVMVRLFAIVLTRIEKASTALEDADDVDALRRLQEDLRGWIGTARRLANDLGMSPTSRARLGLDLVRTRDALGELEDHIRANYGNGDRDVDGDVDAEGEAS